MSALPVTAPICAPPRTGRRLGPLVALLAAGCAAGGKPADSGGAGADGGADGGGGSAEDADGDGVPAGEDCDDAAADRSPGLPEACDGVDNDCDGAPHPDEADGDGDGWPDCAACADAGLWSLARDAGDDAALWAALEGAVAELSCDYSRSRTQIFTSFDLVNGDEVECVYTGRFVEIRGGSPDEDVMNVEHTWPRSMGADGPPAECDVHHLFPTVTPANEARANHDFGEVSSGTSWSDGGSSLGRDASGGTVFEPRDAHKGNVARAMLYVGLRYGREMSGAEAALLGGWHALDPVDPAEQARDAAISRYQGNHNPFVACPQLADRFFSAR